MNPKCRDISYELLELFLNLYIIFDELHFIEISNLMNPKCRDISYELLELFLNFYIIFEELHI